MKKRPILFNAPMVRALLDGTKTQTRRVVKPQPAGEIQRGEPGFNQWIDSKYWERKNQKENRGIGTRGFPCPYGQPGDLLWVREAWRSLRMFNKTPPRDISPLCPVHYEAGGSPAPGDGFWGNLRPSMFMPRWASRITLEIVSVRVERLQDINEVDAIAEGVSPDPQLHGDDDMAVYHAMRNAEKAAGQLGAMAAPIASYAVLWESINDQGSWDANPWVWVVEFRRIEK